jgi:hypothetical protein
MERASGTIEVKIAAGDVLRLRGARGCGVRVVSGRVWITEQSDFRDFLVADEEQYRIGRNGLTLLQAFGEAWVTITPPQTAGRTLEVAA